MPRYWFHMTGDEEGEDIELPNDDAAYRQLLNWSRDVLEEVERRLPPHTVIEFSVSEGSRHIATINVSASRSLH